MKKTGIAAIALLAIVAIVFAVLYFTGNGDLTKIKETLTGEKDALTAQVNELSEAAKRAICCSGSCSSRRRIQITARQISRVNAR